MAFDFTRNYDENLMDNIFFQTLQKEFKEVLVKAVEHNYIICVPKRDSIARYLMELENFLTHILVPTEEVPGGHFSNLRGDKVEINKQVIILHRDVGCHDSARILFQETFYREDGLKHEVLCIEKPLGEEMASNTAHIGALLDNYRDYLNFLSTESEGSETLENIDKEIKEFLRTYDSIDVLKLEEIQDVVDSLQMKCLQIVMCNPSIRKKYKLQKHYFNNLKLAVETYLQQGIYKEIIGAITLCTESEDAKLNKVIRNYTDLCFKDFNINPKFCSNIPKARLILSKLHDYKTSLGKLDCLRRTILAFSESNSDYFPLNADDLLEVLSFLIIRSNLPDWNAQVKFLKMFYHSNHPIFDDNSYLITSIEAAVTYIQSAAFCNAIDRNSVCPEKHNKANVEDFLFEDVSDIKSSKEESLHQFFNQVALGNLESIKEIMSKKNKEVKDLASLNLCHPLCLCDTCSTTLKTVSDISPSVNSSDDQDLTPLHVASMYNVPNVVEYLLSSGANCNAVDYYGRTPAHYAAMRGHQNALLLLLHKGADINAQDNSLSTPLHLCSNNGHDNCVKALIYFSEYLGAELDVSRPDFKGDTPLHHASKWGYRSIVRILLESGADPMILNKKKLSPIDYAHNPKVLEQLKQKCKNVDHYIKITNSTFDFKDQTNMKHKQQMFKGVQPKSVEGLKKAEKVLRAVETGDVNLVCFYMGFEMSDFGKADVNLHVALNDDNNENRKCHPLCTCSDCFRPEKETNTHQSNFVSPNRSKRLNVNICNSEGYTPLHMAAQVGNVDLVRGLIKNGATLNVQTSMKLKTPLMLACEHQKSEVAKELLKAGCNIDMQDHKLKTALHYACNTGNTKLVEVMLKYEPNLKLKNADNKTVLQEAKDKVFIGILRVLKGKSSTDILGP
ncbi:hypothetical protein RUM44_010916 [Polyplax serrata]|uniref:VPS9 domain-containing protein n=1 Tax=Polyplax serrata TaxID=468196 RepID=A0ABR1AQ97_POLSC